ncbi:MAG: hypothetical protein ACI39W_02510 [Brotaphodocola sp.]
MENRKKDDVIVVLLLTIFAFWVNRGMEIHGLYMDDLYLWSCYGEQSFWEYVFPVGSTRFRFLYYLAAWLQLALVGPHVEWFVPINILLNIGIAFTLYRMAKRFSRSTFIGGLLGIAFLASRMAYYQIGQVYGLMETMALWMAIGILYLLCGYLNESDELEKRRFFLASGLYFGICFVHERYMVLLPLFYLVLICRRPRNKRLWFTPAAVFGLVQMIRFQTIGGLAPAGTGGTDVVDTFSVKEAVKYAFSQVAYLFGINAGPEHLNGQNYREAPVVIVMLIVIADLMLLGIVAAFLFRLIQKRKTCRMQLWTSLLFICFIGGCIACSSVTIRVEMRWVYVSYAAALLFLSWLYGTVTEGMVEHGKWTNAVPYMAMITLYVVLMLPVELFYRSMYPNLYYWPNQSRYNSLAEVTYGTYGEEIFGKKIYIVGNEFEMSEFTADTFFKVFDRQRKAEGTTVEHIEDIRKIGFVDGNTLVLKEDPAHDRFLDITQAVKDFKCRVLYGYYEDNWMDEQAKMQVMAGESGCIEMEFYYPRELSEDQWITVSLDEEPEIYLEMTQERMTAELQVRPYQVVNLEFETNFYVPEAQEQRGEKKLAVLMQMRAE